MLAVQAWEKEAAAEHGALTSEQKWEAGRQLVTSLGDPRSAERCMIHILLMPAMLLSSPI